MRRLRAALGAWIMVVLVVAVGAALRADPEAAGVATGADHHVAPGGDESGPAGDAVPATVPAPRPAPAPVIGVTPSTPASTTTTADAAPPTTDAAIGPTTTQPPTASGADGRPRTEGAILLVWTSGGLPDGFADDVAAIDGITADTTVLGDLVRLLDTTDADGAVVDTAPEGWAWPLDAFAVEPASYASFQSPTARDAIAALRTGRAVLTRTSADLRRIGVGGTLTIAGPGGPEAVTVSGIVDDVDGGGAEVLVHRDDAPRLGIDTERFLLVTDTDRAATEQAIRDRTPDGEFLSLRSEAEAPYLRHGDRVDPQVRVKAAFGEFLFADAGGRDIRIEQAWIDANIVTEEVPLLGRITCHRRIVPLVRAAMAELESSGRGDTVDPSRYAGCWNPRRIAPGAGLSRHSWGLAVDLNIGANPRGTFEDQDPALVESLTSRGFNWGGTWEYPDPGHYELRSG